MKAPKRKRMQKEAQALANDVCKDMGIERVSLHVKDIDAGRANSHTMFASIPMWAWSRGESFWRYYVIHECLHFKYGGHGNGFKEAEDEMLAKYDIRIKRHKVYPKAVYYNGQLQWKEKAISKGRRTHGSKRA